MIIFREIEALQRHLSRERQKGKSIGFVPTMGALHKGHLSLITRSKSESDVTVCSIFVNPTQFNDPTDFEKYPITTTQDVQLLIKAETDILFLPSVEEMYPKGTQTTQQYNLGYLETILEGSYRPGHFQGVCQVVHRLLDIVQPHKLFLGQKDYQQCMVLKKLVQIISSPTEIIISETVREESGLAMSSRNMRLSDDQKDNATAIYKVLTSFKTQLNNNTVGELTSAAETILLNSGFNKVDYVAIADADTLEVLLADEIPSTEKPLVALVAAFMGEVRLIDNTLLT
jgi:pantoate--beta-alanine ligase